MHIYRSTQESFSCNHLLLKPPVLHHTITDCMQVFTRSPLSMQASVRAVCYKLYHPDTHAKSSSNKDFTPLGANSHTMHILHKPYTECFIGLTSKCLLKISQHYSCYQYVCFSRQLAAAQTNPRDVQKPGLAVLK